VPRRHGGARGCEGAPDGGRRRLSVVVRLVAHDTEAHWSGGSNSCSTVAS
jgi:hypothetical protein